MGDTRDTDPTPALDEFIAAMDADDNEWWLISCGHHLNLFEDAVDQFRGLEKMVRRTARIARDEYEHLVASSPNSLFSNGYRAALDHIEALAASTGGDTNG